MAYVYVHLYTHRLMFLLLLFSTRISLPTKYHIGLWAQSLQGLWGLGGLVFSPSCLGLFYGFRV